MKSPDAHVANGNTPVSNSGARGTPVDEFATFMQRLRRTFGLRLDSYKRAQVERRLNSLRVKKGFRSFSEFYQALVKEPGLYTELINQLTINVTEFFRNPDRWLVLEQKVLPDLLAVRRSLRIWSAGCASGEEPYSIALVLARIGALREASIHATDLDEDAIRQAQTGRYPQRAIQSVPSDLLARHFRQENGVYVISDEIKRRVQFKRHDLLADRYGVDYDLIVCRNVLIYFTEEAKADIFRRFHDALRPGGYLFVGSTEQIVSPSSYGFVPVDMFFYQKKR